MVRVPGLIAGEPGSRFATVNVKTDQTGDDSGVLRQKSPFTSFFICLRRVTNLWGSKPTRTVFVISTTEEKRKN